MNTSDSPAYDVLVVGGGPAGIAASIASARGGGNTLLVEQASQPGGNVIRSNVHTICGLFENGGDDSESVHLGFPVFFAERLYQRGGAREPTRAGKVHVLPIFPREFASLARDLAADQPGLTLHLNTRLESVIRKDNTWHVRLHNRSTDRRTVHQAQYLLDTSGDAIAAKQAGAACLEPPPDQLQIPSYIAELSGVPNAYLEGFSKLRLQHSVAEGVKENVLPDGCESILLRPGKSDGTGFITLNLPRECGKSFDPTNPDRVRLYEEIARDRLHRIVTFLRKSNDDLRNLSIRSLPERIGIRETRRVEGRTVIDESHVLNGQSCNGAVARSAWPIELWETYKKPRFDLPDAPCEVPLDSLVSRTYPELGAAGRCLSATREALGALRVIATAMDTGQALGFAAALARPDGTLHGVRPSAVRDQKRTHFPCEQHTTTGSTEFKGH